MLVSFADSNVLTAKPKQVLANTRNVKSFLDRTGISQPAEITAGLVESYLSELKSLHHYSDKTILNIRSCISRFCRYLKRRKLIDHNPCVDVECSTPEQSPPPVIEPERMHRVLELARQFGVLELVLIAIGTGLRASEICNLRWVDVDMDGGTLRVVRAKGKMPRVVPLCRPVLAAFRSQHKVSRGMQYVFPARQKWRGGGGRLVDRRSSYDSLLARLDPLRAACPEFQQVAKGSVGRGLHLFRHQFATEALNNNVIETKVAEWMGHTDVRQTRRYARMRRQYDPLIETVGASLDIPSTQTAAAITSAVPASAGLCGP